MVKITLSTHIIVEKRLLPRELLAELRDALTIKNKDKEFAEKEFIATDLADNILLYGESAKHIYLPRGIFEQFLDELVENKVKYEILDLRCFQRADISMDSPITLRDHQSPAADAMELASNGIYKAPPGSGKTVSAVETIFRDKFKTIILVNTIQIADQWRNRIREFTGYEAGIIGDMEFDERDITIALKQTLWRRRDELDDEGFFRRWGAVYYDECHHVTAESYQLVVQMFNAAKIIGLSATPKRTPWTWPIAVATLGPVIHKTEKEHLESKNILVKPELIKIPTDFEFEYRATYLNKGGYRVGNNYGKMVKALVNDKQRNQLIADTLREVSTGRRVLVVSDRLKHLQNISDLTEVGPKYFLTGEESRAARQNIIEKIRSEPGIVFSTIANEALDVPELEILLVVYPSTGGAKLIQQVGRIERYTEKKGKPLLIDFFDRRVDILYNQFRKRLKVYREEGLI